MRRDWGKTLPVVLVVGLIAAFGVGGYAAERAHQKQQTAEVAAGAGKTLADQVLAACKAGGDDAKSLRQQGLCATADDTKDTIKKADVEPKPTPTKYLPPDPARLAALVRHYVFTFCGSDGSCQGLDGKDASQSQVLKAVRQLIDASVLRACGGSCVSTVAGPAGPKGDPGDSVIGPKGDAGRGIQDMHCDASNRIYVQYDDGTTGVIDGSRCRGVDLPPVAE